MSKAVPDGDDLYAVLREWAIARRVHTYLELSQQYQARTGAWFEPHGSWDAPLGSLNQRVHDALDAPALSALVVLKDKGQPGGAFWGCAPNVPPRPKGDVERLAEWSRIVGAVHSFSWPPALPDDG